MNERPVPTRALLLFPGGVALLAGLDAALLLLGVPAPVDSDRLPEVHGVVLVLGFVGTVVALERAVALGRRWGYSAPICLGAGGLLLVAPAPRGLADGLLVAGSALLVAVYVPLWRRTEDVAVVVQAAGAVLATGGALLWLGGVSVPDLLPWFVGFLVLTIAGERLELARVAMVGTGAEQLLVASAGAVVAGVLATLLWPSAGYPLLGAALLALVAWLARFDVARRTVRAAGQARFTAVCLLAGYGWLAAAGLTWLLVGPVRTGGGYDAVVHAVMLGFVLSMILAHAPIVLPAVVRRPLPYRPAMYGPAVLLHGSLLLRLAVGDVRGVGWAVTVGGVLNIVAVLAFLAVAAYSALRPARTEAPA
ncbi:hypothetical protein ACXN1G_04045 [Rhodococcus ruber]|uniref:hypothetical protein n=1 Tax=Rhodococcus TaxID=1827 RepID=UPI000319C5AB|nr:MULTISPECIES: hypothetical protein [Rhodococcus]AXY50437.1 hypothetical protein YT1_0993 [Rhodococcus ruber]MBP2209894.1 hypothetical protein [Rhodococcus ruber]WKK11725.1 hypothetical protein QYN14_24115 [Rhodococcus ruber]